MPTRRRTSPVTMDPQPSVRGTGLRTDATTVTGARQPAERIGANGALQQVRELRHAQPPRPIR